jgi:hypothetical protein
MSAAVRERESRIGVKGISPGGGRLVLSPLEILGILVSLGLVVWTIVHYTTTLRPAQEKLGAAQSQFELQRKGILQSKDPSKDGPSPAERATQTLGSLDSFKHDHLTPFESGRILLINEINALVKKHGLQMTSGIDMSTAAVEGTAVSKGSKASQKKKGELQNVYPNLTVRVSVFGQYDNIRKFVGDVERNKQFLLITSVSLLNQESRVTTGRGARAAGASGIALTIAMQAYFRPENGS